MRLSALSAGTGSGGRPILFDPLPGVRDLPSSLVAADLDDRIAPDVEHSGEASIPDAFFLVEVSESLDGFFRDRGIVMGRANAETALVESDYFRFVARAGFNLITSIPFGVVHRLPC